MGPNSPRPDNGLRTETATGRNRALSPESSTDASSTESEEEYRSDNEYTSPQQPLVVRSPEYGAGSEDVSSMLLQMVPYRPNDNMKQAENTLQHLLLCDVGSSKGLGDDNFSATNKASESTRWLLDKWTMTRSEEISDILDGREGIECAIRYEGSNTGLNNLLMNTDPLQL
jgi:hypothetical protein